MAITIPVSALMSLRGPRFLKTSDMTRFLFVAVPEVLQSGRGREAGADAEGAAGQHSAGLQKGREVMKFKAETIVNFVELSHYHCTTFLCINRTKFSL